MAQTRIERHAGALEMSSLPEGSNMVNDLRQEVRQLEAETQRLEELDAEQGRANHEPTGRPQSVGENNAAGGQGPDENMGGTLYLGGRHHPLASLREPPTVEQTGWRRHVFDNIGYVRPIIVIIVVGGALVTILGVLVVMTMTNKDHDPECKKCGTAGEQAGSDGSQAEGYVPPEGAGNPFKGDNIVATSIIFAVTGIVCCMWARFTWSQQYSSPFEDPADTEAQGTESAPAESSRPSMSTRNRYESDVSSDVELMQQNANRAAKQLADLQMLALMNASSPPTQPVPSIPATKQIPLPSWPSDPVSRESLRHATSESPSSDIVIDVTGTTTFTQPDAERTGDVKPAFQKLPSGLVSATDNDDQQRISTNPSSSPPPDEPDHFNQILDRFGLEDEAHLLAQAGIKTEEDLKTLDEEMIKTLSLTPVGKRKAQRLAKFLSTSAED